MAGDVGCERTHKEKKMQRAEFYSLSQGGKGLWCGERFQQQDVGVLSSYWIIKGVWGCRCTAAGLLGALQYRRFGVVLHMLQFVTYCPCFSSPGGIRSEEEKGSLV